jgi:hypothetical protein
MGERVDASAPVEVMEAPNEVSEGVPADVSEAEIDSALAEEGSGPIAPESPPPDTTASYSSGAVPGGEPAGGVARRSDGTA